MFTGIIEEIGTICGIREKAGSREISIACSLVLDGIKNGDSIAVDGVCLTVETFSDREFSATATTETLRRSTLGTFKNQSSVNLERALRLNDRLGGHLVQGHVDTQAEIVSDKNEGETLYRTLRIAPEYAKYTAEKGSITIDGVSLTISKKAGAELTVAIIPETIKRTTLFKKKPGHFVNIEVDVLARYLESLLVNTPKELSMATLTAAGF